MSGPAAGWWLGRLAVLLAATLLIAPATPAYAHGTDARIVSVLDEIRPPLPAGVLVQVRANLAAQLVADNPTDQPLEVLAPTGEPFLRISRAGVYANLGSPEFFATSNPNGVASRPRGPDRFVRISAGSSWGWYDHRLHPAGVQAPADRGRPARLADFQVPLQYGGAAVTVRGHVEYRPLLGTFQDTVRSLPPGMTAVVLQGQLPGLFVTVSAALTVLGSDGEPFLRSTGSALSVNTASRTYVEDRQARGLSTGPPSPTPRWQPVGGRSYTWLDARLRYPAAAPPAAALRTPGPSVISTWSIPVQGAPPLTGEIRWVPAGSPADEAPTDKASAGSAPEPRSSWPVLLAGLAAVLAVLGLAGVALHRRRR